MESEQVEVPVVEFSSAGGADLYSRVELGGGWVFWRQPSSSEIADNIQDKFLTVLKELGYFLQLDPYFLAQFWVPKEIDGKFYLTTVDQPFIVGPGLYKGLCSYREKCVGHNYFVGEGAKKEELGPIGRVFRNGHPECSSDLRLYSTKEYSLRDVAAGSNATAYVVLPVFDLLGNKLGALEVLFHPLMGSVDYSAPLEALQAAGLRSTHTDGSFFEGVHHRSALDDIRGMLDLVAGCPQLFLAKVWVPCYQCPHACNNWICTVVKTSSPRFESKLVFPKVTDESYEEKSGKRGIFALLLASKNKSCFCRNLCDFSITEEPHVLFARDARLDVYFAICLQRSDARNEFYILEFFLEPGCRKHEHLNPFLYFLLSKMKERLKSFRVASGKQIGEELVVEVITLGKNNEFTSFGWHLLDEFPIRFEIIQYDAEKEDEHGENNVACAGLGFSENAASVENENISTASVEKGISIERSKTSFCLTREDIEPHLGTNQSDAAKELGVSRSTLKRACRELGINRWPSKMENMKNPRLFDKSEENKRARIVKGQIQISTSGSASPSDLPLHQNVPLMNAESNQPLTEFTQADTVLVKANYNGKIIKFSVSISAGMNELVEKVGSRFNLKAGSFDLTYKDEEKDDIFLKIDEDLPLCYKTMNELGEHYIKLIVQLTT